MADDDGPNNLIHFPRVGYTAPTEPPAETPDPAPADVPFAASADVSTVSTDAPEAFAPAIRTSPLDTISALPEPGLGSPFTVGSEPAAAPASAGAMVPATFRSEGAQPAAAPRLGALSLAAILAVSLAAMRGIHSSIASNRASREQREAVAKTASTGKDGSLGGGSKKQVQPSHEYGRKSLQRGSGGPSGRSGGAGPGRSGRGGGGALNGSGGGRRNGATTKSPSGSGGGSRGGRGGSSGAGPGRSNSGSGKGGSGITPLKRSSQGGGPSLKKNRGPGSSGSGGSGGSGGGKGPGNSGGGGRKRSSGSGGGSGSSGGGPSTNRKRGPGFSGSGTGKTGPSSKSPGKGTGSGTSGSKGTGTGEGAGTGPKSGTKKSPRGTTGPSGILRKKPGTTTSGTGPKSKSKGKGTTGPGGAGTTAPGKGGGKKGRTRSGKGGTGPASVPKSPGGKSRKGKKVTLTPGIAHGTFAATDKYGCRCRKCRRFQKEYSRKVLGAMKSAARGRTTFGEAIHETAEKRLKRRRKNMGPPVMTKVKVKKPKKKTGPKTKTTKPGSTKPAGPAATGPTGPAAKAPTRRTLWSTAKARARKRARMRTTTVPGPRPAPTTGPTTPPGPPTKPTPTAPAAPPTPAPAAAVAGSSTATAPGSGTVPGTGAPRLSPFEAMGMATAVSAPAGPITVERADSPRPAPAKSSPGLPAGTSTKESSVNDAWLTKWGSGSVAGMDAEHETEVTLDDTLDVLEELTQQSFQAHETCRKLSAKAREIRHALDELAADLRSRHNILGRLTGAAMAKLAESMELLARKADEMATKSLVAAELCETAENAMFDAYRPLQQATEDTGLEVPAARIHNEN
ncbi:hypothetical protein [Streptomyces sp. NBC_01240]|uniref:hypothetical protein n=1 Tax=Streptomyces sp. NBC_01240 TaxID=2903793 RepID=UPI002E106F49|nr:hypothetical protein OG466_40300 [Streptomyces sp. NBC_01240]